MGVTSIIGLLLFILPGILSEKISYRMDMPTNEKRSEFREIVNGFLLSLPIIAITWAVLSIWYSYETLNEYITAFNNVTYLLLFVLVVFIVSILLGFLKGLFFSKMFTWVTNIIRNSLNRIAIDNKSCWGKLFLEENKSRYLKIIKDDKVHEGFSKYYSLPNEEREIVLEIPEVLYEYPEYKTKFTKIINTYVDIEKNIIIEDYDTTEYEKWCDDLMKIQGN
jgi:hypothetical protein